MDTQELLVLIAGSKFKLNHVKGCQLTNQVVQFDTPSQALPEILKAIEEKKSTCSTIFLGSDAATGHAVWNELVVAPVEDSEDVSITIKPTASVFASKFDSAECTTTYDTTKVCLSCPKCFGISPFEESTDSVLTSFRSVVSASDTLSEELDSDGQSSPHQASASEDDDTQASKCNMKTSASKSSTKKATTIVTSSSSSSTSSMEPLKMNTTTFRQVFLALTASVLPFGAQMPGSMRSFSKTRALQHIKFVAETNLPTTKGTYRIRAYQDLEKPGRDGEYVCVIWGDLKGKDEIPVRVHDQCFTSEVLGSMKCDCREQLEWAMEYIKDKDRNTMECGMVIYLPQEGRGIGLANKLRAYQMQEYGLDTVDANRILGLPDDSREYKCVPAILKDMGIPSIRLITNNPRKVKTMTHLGVSITDRIPCLIPSNPHSDLYLKIKRSRMGHMKGKKTAEV